MRRGGSYRILSSPHVSDIQCMGKAQYLVFVPVVPHKMKTYRHSRWLVIPNRYTDARETKEITKENVSVCGGEGGRECVCACVCVCDTES